MILREIFLTEGATPILYHIVDTGRAVDMFNTAILAPSTSRAEQEHAKGKLFFLSLARMPKNSYSRGKGKGHTIFEIDGRKLGQRYKIGPMDYYGADFRAGRNGDYESEDRLVSDTPTIENFSQYILSVHMCVEKDKPITDGRARKLIQQAKRAGIPVHLYDDEKAFVLLSKANRKAVSDFSFGTEPKRNDYTPRENKNLTYILELLTKTDKKTLSPGSQKYFSSMRTGWGGSEGIDADIHNSKSNKESANYEMATKILVGMKKNNCANITELYEFLMNKWKSGKDSNMSQEEALKLVGGSTRNIHDIPGKYFNDPAFCKQAAMLNDELIQYMPRRFITRQFYLDVIAKNTDALRYSPYRDDKKFQMQAVIRNAQCLRRINSYDYSYEEWKELYLHAITTDANMAGNLGWDDKSEQLKKDKDFWLAAISLNVDAYNYIPREFEEDLDICRIIFQKDQRSSRHYLKREVIYQLEDEMV